MKIVILQIRLIGCRVVEMSEYCLVQGIKSGEHSLLVPLLLLPSMDNVSFFRLTYLPANQRGKQNVGDEHAYGGCMVVD